jgi:hypothetical protein
MVLSIIHPPPEPGQHPKITRYVRLLASMAQMNDGGWLVMTHINHMLLKVFLKIMVAHLRAFVFLLHALM